MRIDSFNINKKIVIIVMALLLTVTIGYALFTESLNISGSAGTGSANLNIVFDRVGSITEVEASNTTADIQEAGKKLVINVPGLKMPTAYAKIPVTIKNKGDIVAKVKQIRTEGLDTTDIKVTYEGVQQEDIFNPNDEKELIVKVTWDESSVSTSVEATFSIEIDFEQVTGSGGGTTSPGETITDFRYEYSGTKLLKLSEAGVEYYKDPKNSVIEIPEGTTEIGDAAFVIPTNFDVTQVPDFDYLYTMMEKYPEGNFPPEEMEKVGAEVQKMEFFEANTGEFKKMFIGKTLKLSDGLIKIGGMAFSGTQVVEDGQGLTGTLTLPSSLKKIGMGAFSFNNFTGSLVIPNSVTEIGAMAFQSNDFNGTLTLSKNLTKIGREAFYINRDFVGNLVIPDTVTELGIGAFGSCGFDGTLTLSKNLKIIKEGTFSSSDFTGDLIIPDSVVEIEKQAFDGNHFTGTLTLSKNLTKIGNLAFSSMYTGKSFTGELYIPNNVTEIGEGAFEYNGFSSISVPTSTKYVTDSRPSFPSGIPINKR